MHRLPHIGVKVPTELKVPSEEDKDEERDLRMKVLRVQLEAAESQIKSSEAIADACAWLKEAAQNVIHTFSGSIVTQDEFGVE